MLLQRQKQICNYCDITISGQCFSRLVFIAFRLWHKRSKWQRAYLQPRPSLLLETWLFWKMAAHVETRTHLLSLSLSVGVEMPFGCGSNLRWTEASVPPAIFMAPSNGRSDGRNPHLPFSVRSYLLSCEAVAMSQIVFKGLESISKAGSFNKMMANCFTNKHVVETKGRVLVLKPDNSRNPKGH